MKKEHLVFLILVTIAAIFGGSTLAIATNYTCLAQHAQELQTAQNNNAEEAASSTLTQANKPVDKAQEPQQLASTATQSGSPQNGEVMGVTPEEKQQIENMLSSLGKSQSSDYASFITDFQSKHSLNPTGYLDTETLNVIIREVALVKASDAVRT
ncbi:MAG TPA: hypothetical protein VN426_12745 [Syntrophomonadaceae bacterium]|nr:hypothetical protein [Syntrophomonadaceae bacterium]